MRSSLARTLRCQAGLRLRQPVAEIWLALPAGDYEQADVELLTELLPEELNARRIRFIEEGSALVQRRVKPLLPVIGPRLGRKDPGRHGGRAGR